MSKALHLEMPPMPGLDPEVRDALNEKLLRIAEQLRKSVDTGAPLQGSHVDRITRYPAEKQAEGRQFYETDTEVTFINRKVGNILVWCYQGGVHVSTLAKRPTGLSRYDNGYLLRVTTGTGGVEYNHLVRWNGPARKWEPADRMGGFFGKYAKTPTEAGWQRADGTATTYLDINAAGELIEVAFTTPDLTSGVYLRGGAAYDGTIHAAGTWSLSGDTGDTSGGTPSGTVSQPTLTMNSYTPAGTVSQPIFTGSPLGNHQHETAILLVGTSLYAALNSFGTGGSVQNVAAVVTGTGSSGTFSGALTGNASAGTPAGTVSQPTFTGTPAVLTGTVSQPTFTGAALAAHHHSLTSGTVTLTGDAVKYMDSLIYFRR